MFSNRASKIKVLDENSAPFFISNYNFLKMQLKLPPTL